MKNPPTKNDVKNNPLTIKAKKTVTDRIGLIYIQRHSVIISPIIVNDAFYQCVKAGVRHGIPESQLILEYDAAGTYTNAAGTMALMRAHGSHPQLS